MRTKNEFILFWEHAFQPDSPHYVNVESLDGFEQVIISDASRIMWSLKRCGYDWTQASLRALARLHEAYLVLTLHQRQYGESPFMDDMQRYLELMDAV